MTMPRLTAVQTPSESAGARRAVPLDAFPEAALLIGALDVSIETLNQRACELLRVRRHEVVGQPLDTIGPRCSLGVEQGGWHTLIEPGLHEQVSISWSDGAQRELTVFVGPIDEGLLLLVLRDTTDRRRVDRELIEKHAQLRLAHERVAQQNERLTRRNQELKQARHALMTLNNELAQARRSLTVNEKLTTLGQFAAGMAHEINNPLAFIVEALAELASYQPTILSLLDSALVGQAAELDDTTRDDCERLRHDLESMLADSRDGAQRIAALVRQVGLYSHMRAAEAERCDLRALVESSLSFFRAPLATRARLRRQLETPVQVICVRSEVNQVVVNLLSNAVQAIEPGSPHEHVVSVAVHTEHDEWAVVEVRDSGCGIAEDELARVTEMFYTTKRPGEGTGIGLALAQGVAERHGGSLELASEGVGLGTTARLRLPLRTVLRESSKPPTRRRPTSSIRSAPNGVRRNVLIVDDEAMLLRALSRRLSRHHDVVTVERPQDVFAYLRDGARFDLVLIDVSMPTCNGPELASRILEIAPELDGHIALMTGGVLPEHTDAVMSSDLPLLGKPLDPSELQALLDGTPEQPR